MTAAFEQSTSSKSRVRVASVATALALTAIVSAGLALRLERAWESLPKLLVYSTPDDAYYYFQIAHNVTHGHNVTFDGDTLTNGFHPLWLLVITPFFAIDDRELSVRFALTLGACFGAATIGLVFEITRRLIENVRASLLAAGFFALHPVFVVYAVNGLETSVALFFIALTTLQFVRMYRSPVSRTSFSYAVLGVSSGLMFLSRTDTALAVPPMLVVLWLRDPPGRRWSGARFALGAGAVTVAPWLVWNVVTFGTIVQVSGLAGGLWDRQVYVALHGDARWPRLIHGVHQVRVEIVSEFPHNYLLPIIPRAVHGFWIKLMLFSAAVVLLPLRVRRETITAAATLSVPFIGLIAALAVEASVRLFVRPWYYAPYALLSAVALGLAAHYVEGAALQARDWIAARAGRSGDALRRLSGAPLSAALYLFIAFTMLRRYDPHRYLWLTYPWQPNVLEAAAWLPQHTAPDARIGSYNAGILGYFSERTVVNLDGVVNYDAYVAARDCTTRDYVRKKRIDYIVDSRGQFALADCGLHFDTDLTLVAKIGETLPAFGGAEQYVMKPKPQE